MTDLFTAPPPSQADPAFPGPRSSRRAQRRRRRRRGRSLLVLVVALVLVGGSGYAVWTNMDWLTGLTSPLESKDYPGPGGDQVEVEIPQGATGQIMGQTLYEAGVVASVSAFTAAFEANPDSVSIRPGTRTMLEEMSAKDAVALLVKNELVDLQVTIPEGFTAAQVVDRAVQVTGLPAEDFEAALDDPEAIGLPPQAKGDVEGWLYPDTYMAKPDSTAEGLLSEMVGRTTRMLEDKGVAPKQWRAVLTKASLVEREGLHAEDRPKIARAIENRLADDMALQIDASVAYGAGKPGTELTRDDLRDEKNRYNTYEHTGLPPGPIASPGDASVEAVLHPTPGDWKFWVTVNLDTGETKFAESYDEHQKNVAELRAWEKANG
ncbi:endolytic transglycosylase MltG [Promicromonospora citrea]|uniref:Endolytic murein transglycosylase n=1 Tax=Promicromonospora citrea TaxID=43677 RepID=A0A8H9GP88_9MICO|nr:endolytic transglycosylase MltG [Promicromonospora citrea]NNH53295.1 endolytic transglycosylase MltG [Promicromonospora citrea]GGM43567.1 ABC transporter substrate-binding protein [Promicromonospora citrea]